MKNIIFIALVCILVSCKNNLNSLQEQQLSTDISDISTKDFREFKVLDSKVISNQDLWQSFNETLEKFSEEKYKTLKPLILEQDIPTIQQHIKNKKLSYQDLVTFYLYRIKTFDRENALSLNSVISLNPNVLEEAKQKDQVLKNNVNTHPIFGMPILLKDNINAEHMPTTAGAVSLAENYTTDSFIVKQLKNQGALILGKANLSEWAYFFCGDCPSGYSAVGGQTLNPYGRRYIDTGGSSSGSAVTVAANFCVAAVGSETSGSILSPSGQNSVVGLKPTIGLLSRSGIIPISSTLDTAGPITKNVTDNAILLDAMFGFDEDDTKSINTKWGTSFYSGFEKLKDLKGIRLGAPKGLLQDSLFVNAINNLKQLGAEIIEFKEEQIKMPGFINLLNLDMKKDLPSYFNTYLNRDLSYKTVEDIIDFNTKDTLKNAPYGQKLFEGIVADDGTAEELNKIKKALFKNGKLYFEIPIKAHKLDGVLSINNYHAGYAAVAEYPAIAIPMGYDKGIPKALTFIAKPLTEKTLLQWAYAFENLTKHRVSPVNYN